MPDQEQIRKLDGLKYRHQAWYAGAGILANVIIGFILLSFVAFMGDRLALGGILVGLSVLLYAARTYVVAYLFPLLALPVVGFFAYSIASSFGEAVGPVATANMLLVDTLMGAVELAGLLNIALALFNMLPLFPLDGGRVFGLVVRRFVGEIGAKRFEMATAMATAGVLVYAVGSDLFLL